MGHKVEGEYLEMLSGVLVKCIVARLCGQLFSRIWRWRSDLVNDENRRWRVDVIFVTWNDLRGGVEDVEDE